MTESSGVIPAAPRVRELGLRAEIVRLLTETSRHRAALIQGPDCRLGSVTLGPLVGRMRLG